MATRRPQQTNGTLLPTCIHDNSHLTSQCSQIPGARRQLNFTVACLTLKGVDGERAVDMVGDLITKLQDLAKV